MSSQIFQSASVFEQFLDELEDYNDCNLIRDRWFSALARIVNYFEEEAFVTSYEVAARLRRHAEETNQF